MIEDLLLDSLVTNEATLQAATDPVVMSAMLKAFSEPGVMRGVAAALRQDLTDEQLALFAKGFEHVSQSPRLRGRK
jgi:hypothetical protein